VGDEIGTLAYLKLLQAALEGQLSGLEKRVTERLDEIEGRLEEMQRCGLEESRSTIVTREECRREIGARLERLEGRDLASLLWESRRFLLGIAGTILSVAGIAAAAAWPAVLPVIDRIGRMVP
jgi:uncharacterized protein involved in exopolysaccharide biosynthesis